MIYKLQRIVLGKQSFLVHLNSYSRASSNYSRRKITNSIIARTIKTNVAGTPSQPTTKSVAVNETVGIDANKGGDKGGVKGNDKAKVDEEKRRIIVPGTPVGSPKPGYDFLKQSAKEKLKAKFKDTMDKEQNLKRREEL
ncbi:hypothetical protein BB559_002073 [Furculomyces boomerangus]|uniref:Uncharacterized protein n=2 Tax=Harpellales TaxID=61421 RepID=A0A2T9YYC9_9FUNG|nr:hypothetical protein BB559_002073 [Furculomyces boomerangus]